MKKITVGIIQFNVKKNIFTNINTIDKLIGTKSADLFVLSELCDIGYLFNDRMQLYSLSYGIDQHPLISYLKSKSYEKKCAFIFGFAYKENSNIFNSVGFIEDGKLKTIYHKKHLTDYEKRFFSIDNNDYPIININNVNIGINVCFDVWFPKEIQHLVLNGAEVIFVAASFGGSQTIKICQARCIENQVPLILSNRIGEEAGEFKATFIGSSGIISNKGEFIENLNGKECCKIVDLIINKEENPICKNYIMEVKKQYE